MINNDWYTDGEFWYYNVEDGFQAGLEKGEVLITIYNGKIKSSSCLPVNIQKAKRICEFYLTVMEKYDEFNLFDVELKDDTIVKLSLNEIDEFAKDKQDEIN